MSVWVCSGEAGCATAYRVRLSRCPRCHNIRLEEHMPKSTRHGGATNAAAAVVPAPAPVADQPVEDRRPEVLWHCLDCTTAYAVGLPACPQCGSTRYSDTPVPAPVPVADDAPTTDEPPPEPTPDEEGGEEPSPGSSSETSPEKPPTNTTPSKPARQSRARKTASRSPKGQTDSSSASGTAGDQTASDDQ